MRIHVLVFALAAAAAAQDAPKKPGYLGVGLAPLQAETRAAFHIPAEITEGAVIRETREGHAAARAGFRKGDVVTSFAGKPVRTIDDLVAALRGRHSGDRVAYTLRRGSGTIEGFLTLGARDDPVAHEPGPEPPPPPSKAPKATDAPMTDRRPARAPDDVEGRLNDLDKTLRELREKAKKVQPDRPARQPRGLEAWMKRERASLERARKANNEREAHFHEIRLGLLEELRKANVGAGGRIGRLERKVDEILALLKQKQR